MLQRELLTPGNVCIVVLLEVGISVHLFHEVYNNVAKLYVLWVYKAWPREFFVV